ncbi:MAG TPA: phosphatase PAP2 family protein, partial [Marivita sp.]|nr:phosphatase PAP2 family protein [Marivita sp.]
ELPFSDPSNIDGLATWVRGSLYVSEFLAGISATPVAPSGADTAKVHLSFNGNQCLSIDRPDNTLLRKQCSYVSDYATLRAERSAEITSQLGFPTPYFAMMLGLHSAQNAKTFELITATQVAAAHAAMIVKNHLAIRRPDQLDAQLMPMIPTPGHGSFPSAHATEAYAVLTVLEKLIHVWDSLSDAPERILALRGLAERIAVNRTVAGVHYPIDSWAGAALGRIVGQVILAKCLPGETVHGIAYTAAHHDFFGEDFFDPAVAAAKGLTMTGQVHTLDQTDTFSWVWGKAADEAQKA